MNCSFFYLNKQKKETCFRLFKMVWKTTNRVGCGRVTKEEYGGLMTYIVCNYGPKGNVPGLFNKNVLPLTNNGNKRIFFY